MPAETPSKPVGDTVSKVDNELAVASDLEFQRRWWKFEVGVWTLFTILIVLAATGCLGRGPLAKKKLRASDGSLQVEYERIARFGTPGVLRVEPSADTVHSGEVRLWAGNSLLTELGSQRVLPQPSQSLLSSGGVEYVFRAATAPLSIEFGLQPNSPGFHDLTLRAEGGEPVHLRIFVMP